jgi:hypothetical protein
VREGTIGTRASATFDEVHAQWCPFGGRVVRQIACRSGVWTVAEEEIPTDCYLIRIMLVKARKTTIASTWNSEEIVGLVNKQEVSRKSLNV